MTYPLFGARERLLMKFWLRAKLMESGCFEWQGTLREKGYGRLYHLGRLGDAHRVAWELTRGPIPDGLYVCHKCDNPPCVNPDHLWLGTNTDNMRDMVRKGRHGNSRKTHCKHGHELTPENTYWVPSRTANRACRVCVRDNQRRYRQRKAAK